MIDKYTQKCLEQIFKQFREFNQTEFVEFASEEDPDNPEYNPPTKKELIAWYKNRTMSDPSKQITKKRNMRIKKYRVASIPGSYQMDLVFFFADLPWLMIIHVPSRYVWLFRLQNKSTDEVFSCLRDWYYQDQPEKERKTEEYERFVNTITTDQESAFMSEKVQKFCKDHGIKYYIKDTTEHYPLFVLDSAVRKIKDLLRLNLSDDSYLSKLKINFDNKKQVLKYIDRLDNLVIKSMIQYNRKPINKHLRGFWPVEVLYGEDFQNYLYKRDSKYNRKVKDNNDYEQPLEVGDYVRIKQRKINAFQKARFFSDDIYRILAKYRFSYKVGFIDDETGEKIEVFPVSAYRFKPHELLKVKSDSGNIGIQDALSDIKKHKKQVKNKASTKVVKPLSSTKQFFKRPNTVVSTRSTSSRSNRNITSTLNKNKDYQYY